MGPLPQTLHPHPSYPSWLCGLFPLRDSHQIIDAPPLSSYTYPQLCPWPGKGLWTTPLKSVTDLLFLDTVGALAFSVTSCSWGSALF